MQKERETLAAVLPRRKRDSHKGTYGKAAIVAGSIEYTGAAYLAAAACLRSGVGYTALFVPDGILPYYILKAPEVLLRPLKGHDRLVFDKESFKAILDYDAVAYGMGMGVSEHVARGAEYLITNYKGKLVLDADALNSLAAFRFADLDGIFQRKTCDVLITPHAKEFSRISGESLETVLADGEKIASAFAKKHGICVLLKSAYSRITDGERVVVNTTGNSGQAKGGTGDVLSGLIAGLCASGASAFDGARLGSYLVGKAAELAAVKTGEYAMTASELISHLGGAFLCLTIAEDTNK